MKKCVFVLEDNDELRELFTYILEQESHEVQAFPTAAAFWERIGNFLPDLFLLDVMLPDGNGLDICCELKKDPKTAAIPVIVTSAHADLKQMNKKCAAEEFLAKPFDIYEFVDKVERHLQLQ